MQAQQSATRKGAKNLTAYANVGVTAKKPALVKSAAKLKAEANKAAIAADAKALLKREKAATLALNKTVAKLGTLEAARNAYVQADGNVRLSASAYARILGDTFGEDCHTFKLTMIADGGNRAPAIAAFFKEKEAYYAAFKAGFKGFGRPNPTVSWTRAVEAVSDAYNRATGALDGSTGEKGKGAKKTPLEAFKRDLPSLYLRANNAEDFDRNMKLQEVSRHVGEALKLILSPAEFQAINEKIGK